MYKIQLQRLFFWNLQQMGKVTRLFCWHQDFVHKGLSASAPGLYTCGKTVKMCIKSEFKEICLKLATNGQSDKGFLLTSKVWPQGFSALAPGLYTCIKSIKMCIKSDFEEIIMKHMGKGKRPFCCHQNFVPKGLSAPALGLYTCIKALKYIPGPGVRWAFTEPLILWLDVYGNYVCFFQSVPGKLLVAKLPPRKGIFSIVYIEIFRLQLISVCHFLPHKVFFISCLMQVLFVKILIA